MNDVEKLNEDEAKEYKFTLEQYCDRCKEGYSNDELNKMDYIENDSCDGCYEVDDNAAWEAEHVA